MWHCCLNYNNYQSGQVKRQFDSNGWSLITGAGHWLRPAGGVVALTFALSARFFVSFAQFLFLFGNVGRKFSFVSADIWNFMLMKYI